MENFERHFSLIPKERGNYVLFFFLKHEKILSIGSLGLSKFPVGQYVYLGSALGPGGIQARVRHHLRPSPKPHWHIDYLKPFVHWLGVGWKITDKRWECTWTQQLKGHEVTNIPVVGFGASDCKQGCQSHLIEVTKLESSPLKMLAIESQIDFMYNKTNL